MDLLISRRSFLIGCSAAASPLITRIGFAAAPGENRLVVIVLRGAMDGLDVLRPVGDPAYASLRPTLAEGEGGAPLDGFFALHPAAAPLLPLWQTGELGFAHAVATPYRRRSHFTGQDFLENGGGAADGALTPGRDGWLNRAIGLIPGAGPRAGVTVGRERMLILEGAADTAHWMPVADPRLSAQGRLLLDELHGADPLFAPVWTGAQALATETAAGPNPKGDLAATDIGTHVAARLVADARIATFSLGGWDMHQGQARLMADRLAALAQTVLALRAGLGAHWGTTLVLAMTEFGRTARENGSGGTDHGTGGAMLMAGGALRGGRVLGRWPGLAEADLLNRRDLMPTADVRAHAAQALAGMFGLARGDLERVVFPGLDMGGAEPVLR
ncbi:DUF1501 domain-containing protein [Ruixingdingia sedimenti]|uniref:DUF1501 domain-containing protein n=1 Tax=Ruixingdingia sedimenti TaxID=3073604 RepID=A0ABU1F7K2_9RHOB|nr:DUF1501 domain-containing protein [Xinfangfangia sp. LG-4]MDR5652860.1 DUF1501 domain-containing protein [Xinfangfangia sp. LG-4]